LFLRFPCVPRLVVENRCFQHWKKNEMPDLLAFDLSVIVRSFDMQRKGFMVKWKVSGDVKAELLEFFSQFAKR